MKMLSQLAAFVLFVLASSASMAAGEQRRLDGFPADYVKRMQPLQKALGFDEDPNTARGIYIRLLVWNPSYRKLDACFFGGSDELRARCRKCGLLDAVRAGDRLRFRRAGQIPQLRRRSK